jgi:hypothetical protein
MANNDRVTQQQLLSYLSSFWASAQQTIQVDGEIIRPLQEILGADLYNYAAKMRRLYKCLPKRFFLGGATIFLHYQSKSQFIKF